NATYTLCVMKASDIPSMFIVTASGSLDKIHSNKDYKETGTMILVQPDGTVEYDGNLATIKGRGNTTWNLNKKPYNIKLDKATNLLDMGKSKHWVLLANAQEPTQMRNKLAYDLADTVGLRYSIKSSFIDLYINGEYLGVYQLCQKVELGKNDVVNITDLEKLTEEANSVDDLSTFSKYTSGTTHAYNIPNNPTDITGGYLLEYNSNQNGVSCFQTTLKQCVDIKSPEYASVEQVQYIKNYVQAAENAVYSADGYNSEGKYYTDYFDLDSCVKMYLIQELSKNVDSCITSCFFHKDTDSNGGKLTAGPAWDFDVALGNLWGKDANGQYYDLSNPEGLWAAIAPNNTMKKGTLTLFAAMYQHEDFVQRATEIWKEEFLPAIHVILGEQARNTESVQSIDSYESSFADSVKMNYTRWKLTDNLLVNSGTTHEENIAYLKNFISKRTEFISTAFLPLDEAKTEVKNSLEAFFATVNNYDTGSDYDKITEIKEQALTDIDAAESVEKATTIKQKAIEDMKQYMKVTVYFDNTVVNWTTPYIHVWNTKNGETSWPGMAMEEYRDGIYTATVSCNASIIFDDGQDYAQTVDITELPTETAVYVIDLNSNQSGDGSRAYYSGSWQTYSVEQSDKTELQSLFDEAKAYFTEDIAALGTALEDTDALLHKQNPSQEKLNQQAEVLKTVLEKLKKEPSTATGEEKPAENNTVFPTVIITTIIVSAVWGIILFVLNKRKSQNT
ncbi:MAG: CotH kinase family protein, partial [Acutalibacteraceae bacterium]